MPRTLAELQQRLKTQYQKHASIERLFYPENPLPLEQCFLELTLMALSTMKRNTPTRMSPCKENLMGCFIS